MTFSPKSTLRQHALQRREAITKSEHAAWSKDCCARLMRHITGLSNRPKVIAGYASIKSELDIFPLFSLLEAGPFITALPVVPPYHKVLAFYRWKTSDPLFDGRHAVREPSQEAALVVPDVVIVPLLAFDRTGHRLGYGGGYYDATLSTLKQENPALLAIGVGFSLQEVASLPAEPHDTMLDAVVTEKEIIGIE